MVSTPVRRDRIVVSAAPGSRAGFRWEILPPHKSDPPLASDYVFATRRAAILDARFFLLKQGRTGILQRHDP